MSDFPEVVDLPLRQRFAALGVHPADVIERFIRGTGAGGQKINKTSSTVSLRHEPSGLEVRCQRERSQSTNRRLAWFELCARLEERQHTERARQVGEQEQDRRRHRQKSRGQKVRMIQSKKHRAKTKSGRGRVESD